jgi:hypothetical protein
MPAYDPSYVRKVTDVPLREWRVHAGPSGIEVGSRYYATLLDRKRPKKRGERLAPDELIRPCRTCIRCGTRLPV